MSQSISSPPRARVSLKDVAGAAGVGVTTVSDILNRNIVGKYPPETRARVFNAMKETGYTPSRSAQKLRGTRSREIGVVLTREFDNPFFARLAHQFQRQLRQLGYRMQLQVTGRDLWTLSRFPMELLGDDVDAVILGPVYVSDRDHLDPLSAFSNASMPVALFGGPCDSGFDEYCLPHFDAGYLAGKLLFDAGHRRVAFPGGAPTDATGDQTSKDDGVCEAARECGATVEFIPHPDTDDYDDFYHTAAAFGRNWKRAAPDDRATGVVCRNDQMAIAAIAAWHDLGIDVPADLSVVGMDNLPESRIVRPGLSTIDLRMNDHVTQIVSRVVGRLEGRQVGAPVIPKPQQVVRDSVRPVQ
ncbi:MAG: LacI family DNA-binding transcriptional regulator [Planctomycetota bacterium]